MENCDTYSGCSLGSSHSICVADGNVYSFGSNAFGQLGFSENNVFSFKPHLITNIPKITVVSCGEQSTICIDEQGSMWSFGQNYYGQLGTGNLECQKTPQKIQNIPIARDVSCGYQHTLFIASVQDELWAVGNNSFGQLCNGKSFNISTPEKTKYSNISNISAGYYHSIFQNYNGELFGCGNNEYGQLGFGHFDAFQTNVQMLPNHPSNIIQFCCGSYHSLFLNNDGKVFSVGYNQEGELGLGNDTNQAILHQIPNIPPILFISCTRSSSYLLDCYGKLWSFGSNKFGQLGLGDVFPRNTPVATSLTNIQQISGGCCAFHALSKNSLNEVFSMGKNDYGQACSQNTLRIESPIKYSINFKIWGETHKTYIKAKSARK